MKTNRVKRLERLGKPPFRPKTVSPGDHDKKPYIFFLGSKSLKKMHYGLRIDNMKLSTPG